MPTPTLAVCCEVRKLDEVVPVAVEAALLDAPNAVLELEVQPAAVDVEELLVVAPLEEAPVLLVGVHCVLTELATTGIDVSLVSK